MKVAFVLWPIDQEGGLATHTVAWMALCDRNGIDNNFYRLQYSDRHHGTQAAPTGITINPSGLRMMGRNLSITDAKLGETLDHLDGYDAVVLVHPCPHLSDTAAAVKNWRKVYTELNTRKIVYFSDVYAGDYYPWIEEVTGFYEPVAFNTGVANYVRETLGIEAKVIPAPWVHMPRSYSRWRERKVLWTCAWRGWKGIKRFCAAVPDIDAHVRLYGTGRELRNWRKVMPADWPGELMGARQPAEVERDYQSAYASVDLTGQSPKYFGHYNRTTQEPMLYGAVSVTWPTLVEPYSHIPRECVWTIEKDHEAEGINELLAKPELADTIRQTAHDWIRAECEDERVLDALFRKSVELDTHVTSGRT